MKVSKLAKKMMLVVAVAALAFIAASALYYRSLGFLPFAIGTALGAGLNVLKIAILEQTVDKTISMEKKQAGNYLRVQYLLRFLLTGAVLVLAAVVPWISIWGAAAGIITLQIAAFSMKRFHREDGEAQPN